MIRVIRKFDDLPEGEWVEVDTTSRGAFKDLSPFYLGPITYNCPHFGKLECLRFENLWQYCKVYNDHTTMTGAGTYTPEPQIAPSYYEWRNAGFKQYRAIRYPMGKGAKPLFSLWGLERLGYIKSRKRIYAPIYADLVRTTRSYKLLYDWVLEGRNIILKDFDGYDRIGMGISLEQVVNDPKRIMGHAFVIEALLTGQMNVFNS